MVFKGGVAWSACVLGRLYRKHCKGLTHDKCNLVTTNRKGSCIGGHVSHRDPGAVDGVGDADLQLLQSPPPTLCWPALGRAWQEGSWLTREAGGAPGWSWRYVGRHHKENNFIGRRHIYSFDKHSLHLWAEP